MASQPTRQAGRQAGKKAGVGSAFFLKYLNDKKGERETKLGSAAHNFFGKRFKSESILWKFDKLF